MKNYLLAASVVALCSGVAWADPAFVAPLQFDAVDMLPAPPANGGDVQKNDLAVLHHIQDTRSAGDIAQAQADAANRTVFLFATIFGGRFNAASLPLTAALSAQVEATEKQDAEPVKFVFARVRPYHFDKTLTPACNATKKDDSYPSGHTMSGYLEALTLASMLPEKKDAIFARADAYAHNRLVCGVHYPSDVEAGKEIAYALFAVLDEDPRFKAERAAAAAELRKALGLQAAAK